MECTDQGRVFATPGQLYKAMCVLCATIIILTAVPSTRAANSPGASTASAASDTSDTPAASAAPSASGKAASGEKPHPATSSAVATPLPGDSLAKIWSSRIDSVQTLVDEAEKLQKNAEKLSGPMSEALRTARTQFSRLTSLYQASRGHPTEQLTLVQQMRLLRQSLKNNMAAMVEADATIQSRVNELAALSGDVKDLAAQELPGEDASSEESKARAQYTKELNTASRKLAPAAKRISSLLAPSQAVLDRMDKSIDDIENSLVAVWENYYLTPSGNTLDALTSVPALLADWAPSLYSRVAFAYPQTQADWWSAIKALGGTIILMGFIGFLALRGGQALPDEWNAAVRRIIKGSWVWVAVGLSLLAASTNRNGGIYFGFVLFGSLIIIAGVAALSWRLRITMDPELENEQAPLFRLYIPAAIGVMMLFSDLPTRILGIAWGLCMVGFIIFIIRENKQQKTNTQLPLLERLAYGSALWFGIASLFVAVAGYARMAILVYMALFALVNTIILGGALTGLNETLAQKLFNPKEKPIRNTIAQAVGIPVAWAFSLLCTLPWIWAVPGARYLLQNAMSTNYTVGEASFDFSKLLLLAVLFFLFRSFITFGRTTLEHLPDRLPSMERGVVPPLTTLLTYGLWAVFGLIGLGILGVNFTSLAVVAGGLSVGIGFGMQNIFNNLASGLLLIFGRNILVGDWVDIGGTSGTVKAISIRSTTIETAERALVYVPNSTIMSGSFTNWTRGSRIVRRSINIGIAYGSDTTLASKLLLQAAKEHQNVLVLPAPSVFFTNFGASSLDFTMNVFIDDFNNATRAISDLRFAVEKLFTENGIDIPFPQITLHTPDNKKTAPLTAQLAPEALKESQNTAGNVK